MSVRFFLVSACSVAMVAVMLPAEASTVQGSPNTRHGAPSTRQVSAVHQGHVSTIHPHASEGSCVDTTTGDDSGMAIVSQTFTDEGNDIYDSAGAQVFTLAQKCVASQIDVAGQYFNGAGRADSETVTFYKVQKNLPATVISSQTVRGNDSGGSFAIPLKPVTLKAGGTFAVSVQVNMSRSKGGEWGWEIGTGSSASEGLWQNPKGGFGNGCKTWGPLNSCFEGGLARPHFQLTLGYPRVLSCSTLSAGLMIIHGCHYQDSQFTYEYPAQATVNGITYSASAFNPIMVDLSSQSIQASNVTVSVSAGGQTTFLYTGSISNNYSTGSYSIPMNAVVIFLGMPITTNLGTLPLIIPQAGASKAYFNFKLPQDLGGLGAAGSFMVVDGGGVTATLTATNFNIPNTSLNEHGLTLTYTSPGNTWTGDFKLKLPGTDYDFDLAGSISIVNNALTFNSFGVGVSGLDIPIGSTGAFIDGATLAFQFPPNPVLSGSLTVTAGPKILGVRAASASGNFSYNFGSQTFTLTSNVSIVGHAISTPVVTVTPYSFHASGTFNYSVSCLSANGQIAGDVDAGGFNLIGSMSTSLCGFNVTASGVVSSNGVAACGYYNAFWQTHSIGAGYHWGGGGSVFNNCNLAPYSYPKRIRGLVRAGDRQDVSVSPGRDIVVFAVTGDTGIPDVVVNGPGGESIESNVAGVFDDGHYAVGLDPDNDIAYVVVDRPTGGTWTVTRKGGAQVVSLGHAESLPDPQVSASVKPGTGTRKVLTWNLTPLPDQSVTFVEQGSLGSQTLLTTADATGQYTFTPADGVGEERTIEALVLNDGLVRTEMPVATYDAPALATLAVTAQGQLGGSGTVTSDDGTLSCGTAGSQCSAAEAAGSTVTLTAHPDAGSKFLGWGNGLCTGTGACPVTMNGPTGATAIFVRDIPAVVPTMKVAATQAHPSFKVSWKSKDKNVVSYDVDYIAAPTAGGTYTDPISWLEGTAAINGKFQGARNYSFCFSARETNAAGNTSAWSTPLCTSTSAQPHPGEQLSWLGFGQR